MNQSIVFGPPGTGKTTTLLGLVEKHIQDGVDPSRIAFIAFTRKAAGEARDRAAEKLFLSESTAPWFRTLHSAGFRLLGLNRAQIMGPGDYITLAKHLGLFLTLNKRNDDDDTFSGATKGDRLFFTENLARIRGKTLRSMWEELPDEDLDWVELSRVRSILEEYKRKNSKLDFTDIIEQIVNQQIQMPVDIAFVDEAQDLSPLQWEAVKTLFHGTRELCLAGDDDQAIYRWAGADVDRLLTAEGSRVVLPQSYRVPKSIQEQAIRVVSGIEKRVPKSWEPTSRAGKVSHVSSLDQIDMSSGTWLLLGRNAHVLEQYVEHCIRSGFVFDSVRDNPVKGDSLKAIVHWERLRAGGSLPCADAAKAVSYMTIGHGVEYGGKSRLDREKPERMTNIKELHDRFGVTTVSIWHEALDRIPQAEKQYFLEARRRGEKLLSNPRIKISTIHGAKGGEADNVVIIPDMAGRTWKEFETNPDDEHRVWYVAVTRARETVYIVEPSSNYYYSF